MRVCLVSMPFAPADYPSLGLSLLKSILQEQSIACDIKYLFLPFAKQIGVEIYNQIAEGKPALADLAGEWIFSKSLFPSRNSEITQYYIDQHLYRNDTSIRRYNEIDFDLNRSILSASEIAGQFIDACAEKQYWSQYDVVGFTSMFQQNVASLALASRLKARLPNLCIVFGGPNFEQEMGREYVDQFSFIDFAFSGEADRTFLEFLKSRKSNVDLRQIPGLIHRQESSDGMSCQTILNPQQLNRALDELPYPDFSDYFVQLKEVALHSVIDAIIPFESSRGCWWGERSHCVFCGLNGGTMTFRSKQPSRVLEELDYLQHRYGSRRMLAADTIMDNSYFKTLLPHLASRKFASSIYYETKANLKRTQLRAMREAGITMFQPGIESLNSGVLKLIGKGVSGIANIQLLRWAQSEGVGPMWNLLWGFPGERVEWYEEMTEILPKLEHLQPPNVATEFRLDRFSPLFEKAKQYGLTDVKPAIAYRLIYDLPSSSLAKIAYYFQCHNIAQPLIESYTAPLFGAVRRWKENYQKAQLRIRALEGNLVVHDTRSVSKRTVTYLDIASFEFLRFCDRAQPNDAAQKYALSLYGGDGRSARSLIESLDAANLIIQMDGAVLALPILSSDLLEEAARGREADRYFAVQ